MAIKTFEKLAENEKRELKKGVIEITGKAMNRTALGVVDAVFTMFPDITFAELKKMLPDEINPSAPKNFKSIFKPFTDKMYGVVQPGSIRKEISDQGLKIEASHFIEKGETFKTSDGIEVLVSKIWETEDTETKEHDLQNLINHVEKFGIRVTKVEKKVAFNKGGHHLEIINPQLLSSILNPKTEAPLETPQKKKFPWWILILILLALLVFVFFFLKSKSEKEVIEPIKTETSINENTNSSNEPSTLTEIKAQIESGENTEGKSVSFHEILFEKDSDVLLTESEVYLNEVFQIMKDIPKLKILVIGHTSSEGEEVYNIELSKNRANAVVKYLQNKGIENTRISSDGKGSTNPLISNDSEEGRKQNRRIEFVIMEDGNL